MNGNNGRNWYFNVTSESANACCNNLLCPQAAREIAGTIATANNRVLLNSESLLLNLVSQLSLGPMLQADDALIGNCVSTFDGEYVQRIEPSH